VIGAGRMLLVRRDGTRECHDAGGAQDESATMGGQAQDIQLQLQEIQNTLSKVVATKRFTYLD
jgi:hypothetical protein